MEHTKTCIHDAFGCHQAETGWRHTTASHPATGHCVCVTQGAPLLVVPFLHAVFPEPVFLLRNHTDRFQPGTITTSIYLH